MGKWDKKNNVDYIINNKSFLCGKCNTLVSLAAGVDYYYFGNGKSGNPGVSDRGIYMSSSNSYMPTVEYFSGDHVTWKCEKCKAININLALSSDPKSIIPISNEYAEIKEITKIPENESELKKLIEEFYKAKSLGFNSSATLLGRKILMHICVEQKIANEGQKFIEYVDALKKSELIGLKWKAKVDALRTLGNDEAHKIKIASDEELNLISSIIKNLLTNIYVD